MNVFVKPGTAPNEVRAMPKRENEERNSTLWKTDRDTILRNSKTTIT